MSKLDEIDENFEAWNWFRNNILEVFPDLDFEKLNPLCLKLAKAWYEEHTNNDLEKIK